MKSEFFTTEFQSEQELVSFLEKENNTYSKFILERYDRHKRKPEGYQVHHIKPKHADGTDDAFNLIWLSLEEHAQAHLLLFECYGSHFDQGAFCMMKGKRQEAQAALRKQIHQNMKEQGKGFWDYELQRELGKRPKNRKPYSRNDYVKAALERGFILQFALTNECVYFSPSECGNLREVLEVWLKRPSMIHRYDSWQTAEKKQKHTLYTALTRCLTGHRDKKTNKAVYSVAGWRILGIVLSDEDLGSSGKDLKLPKENEIFEF